MTCIGGMWLHHTICNSFKQESTPWTSIWGKALGEWAISQGCVGRWGWTVWVSTPGQGQAKVWWQSLLSQTDQVPYVPYKRESGASTSVSTKSTKTQGALDSWWIGCFQKDQEQPTLGPQGESGAFQGDGLWNEHPVPFVHWASWLRVLLKSCICCFKTNGL